MGAGERGISAGHGKLYGDYSARAREIVERFSPAVIAASIDEHYLDFSGCERMYRRRNDADDDATILRVVLIVRAGTEAETLAPLGVRKLPGIGPVAEARLHN